MAEPTTTNTALIVPNTGDLPGTWGSAALNPNFTALDGFFGGVQTIGLSNTNVTLTAPSGSITPSGGPTQAQNAILRFTGAISTNIQITLPLPGFYIVENLTTGNFVVTFSAVTSTQIIAVDQGMVQHIENDGANVKFVNLARIGQMEFWAGYTAMPAWVTACTVPPYLLCNGSTFNISTYPYIGARFGTNFGGNGISTAATPDMQGRVPLAYDGTGTRITSAVCGINGQTMGAAGGSQAMQQHNHPITDPGHTHSFTNGSPLNNANATNESPGPFPAPSGTCGLTSSTTGISINNTGAGSSQNVQPAQVAGIWVVRAA